jgi:hypothetical protein
MLYLATQYAWFLLAAFTIGGVMGWIGCTGRMQFSAGLLPYAIAAWLLAVVVTGLQGVNGAAALWIETALLYVAAYLVGCCLACLIRTALLARMPEPAVVAGAGAANPDSAPAVSPVENAARSEVDRAIAASQTPPDDAKAPVKPARRKRAKQDKA